jgi:hypothetical protein
MRLRRTAVAWAFLMLQPNRLRPRPLGRRKIVNSRLDLRRPSRYTASYSARRTKRHSRGRPSRGGSDARETVAPFPATLRKDFPSTLALHARAIAMLLMTGAHVGLISAFRQRLSPLDLPGLSGAVQAALVVPRVSWRHDRANRRARRRSRNRPAQGSRQQSQIAEPSETASVVDRRGTVKERRIEWIELIALRSPS